MMIEKKYHFYAAHRNKEAGEKCGRIHGHTYDIECGLQFNGGGDVEMLFSDIDAIIEPIIKNHCHWLLLHDKDTLCGVLNDVGEPYMALPFATSAENLARYFFNRIHDAGLPIFRIALAETKTSKVIYEPKS